MSFLQSPSRIRSSALALAGLLLSCSFPILAAEVAGPDDIAVLPVKGNVYMLVMGGTNIAAQVGPQGVLLVDTGSAQWSPKLLSLIERRFEKPIQYIINTSSDEDRAGGNAAIAKARGVGKGPDDPNLKIFSSEAANFRLTGSSGPKEAIPEEGRPSSSFASEKKKMYFNGEAIELIRLESAHTDGDILVFFRGSDVIAAGNAFVTSSYPLIDSSRGGNIQGSLEALNRILDITVPEYYESGGTMVIPGRGRLCNEADVNEVRNAITIIRDRIAAMVDKRMSLEQIKAAKPTLDYDGIFAGAGNATGGPFIETVYRDLQAQMAESSGTERKSQ